MISRTLKEKRSAVYRPPGHSKVTRDSKVRLHRRIQNTWAGVLSWSSGVAAGSFADASSGASSFSLSQVRPQRIRSGGSPSP